MTAEEAIQIAELTKKPCKAIGLGETDELFIVVLDNDDEGYETVNKNTKEVGFMWMWEFGHLVAEGKAKKLDIEQYRAS